MFVTCVKVTVARVHVHRPTDSGQPSTLLRQSPRSCLSVPAHPEYYSGVPRYSRLRRLISDRMGKDEHGLRDQDHSASVLATTYWYVNDSI